MQKKIITAPVVFILVFLVSACAPKPKEALKQAEQAVSEAEEKNAAESWPELVDQARRHIAQGKEYQARLRYGLARAEFEAALADARLALALKAPETAAPAAECPPAPSQEEVQSLKQQNENLRRGLDAEKEKARDLMRNLELCRSAKAGKTVVVEKPCPPPAAPTEAEKPVPVQALMGTLVVQPPPMLKKGVREYKVKVKYVSSRLRPEAAAAAENNYRILLDVYDVEPREVEVVSPTADFESLSERGGVWELPLTVPQQAKGAVSFKIKATLLNAATGQEETLPPIAVAIPDGRACPDCPECPPPLQPLEKKRPSPALLILALLAGAIGGAALVALFGRRKSA